MELRRIHLIGVFCCASAAFGANGVHTFVLDDRTVYTIRISGDVPTTCVFPGAITELEGARVAAKPEAGADVLLSATARAPYFSVRALRAAATGALNVVFRGRVYVLSFVGDGPADRVVRFVDRDKRPAGELDYMARLKRILADAKRRVEGGEQVEHVTPGSVTDYVGFSAIVTDVYRYTAEKVLVFRVRLANTTSEAVRYDPTGLAVRVGPEEFPAGVADASGVIPARGQSEVWLAVPDLPDEPEGNRAAKEAFSVVVPKP